MASVLEEQLENWYAVLHPLIRFDRDAINIDTFDANGPLAPIVDDHIAFLRLQYYGAMFAINWPCVTSIHESKEANISPEKLPHIKSFITAALKFIACAGSLFDHRTPNLWTIAQRYTRCGDSVNLV
jgi:hypothetical protein